MDSDRPFAPPAAPEPAILKMRGGRLVFRARRPAALVVPLAAGTEIAGILFVVNGATIGWFVIAAPVVALLFTGVLLRPTLELTRDGLAHRQYPFSMLNPCDAIDDPRCCWPPSRRTCTTRRVARDCLQRSAEASGALVRYRRVRPPAGVEGVAFLPAHPAGGPGISQPHFGDVQWRTPPRKLLPMTAPRP